MILLCGIPSESPIAFVREQLDALDTPYIHFNQRQFARMRMQFGIETNGALAGTLTIEEQVIPLDSIQGVYIRLMDDQALPELKDAPADSPLRKHSRALHDTLMRWCEIAPCRVLNRMAPMGSNGSKPYQAQLIQAQGFLTPETLVTNSPEKVREFLALHGRVIYKSLSGVRSIVQTLQEEDNARLEHIRWCPTQFQAFVEGVNVRVHVVGEETFATAITSDATDYRYAHKEPGGEAELKAVTLSEELSARCVRLARALRLPFAGIDLKITPEEDVYCFEVNPSPAFSYYEANTGQPIANAVARYLAGS